MGFARTGGGWGSSSAPEPGKGGGEQRSGSVSSAATLNGLRVLVVEDDPDARELVSTILADAGAVVESASSAAEGFEAVRTFQPQLLLSDIGMPGEDGYSLIRRVRRLDAAEGGAVPSIALSAFTSAQDRSRALRSGFTVHLGKPVMVHELVCAVVNLAALVPR